MKKYNVTIAVIIILMLAGSITMIFVFNRPSEGTPEFDYLKDYKDNEYMPIYISEEKMASIYLNDYKYYLINDSKTAYDLLNENYRKIKFSGLVEFQSYIESYKNAEIASYSVEHREDKTIFYLKLSDGSSIIFSTSGVMKYEIYFDEMTTSIE